jgi:type II secretory pathway component PulF
MKFSYNGISTSGEARSGSISAVDHDAAIAKLQQKGIYITDIRESASKQGKTQPNVGLWDEISAFLPIKNSQKNLFLPTVCINASLGAFRVRRLGYFAWHTAWRYAPNHR